MTAPAAERGPVLTVQEVAAYLRISRGLAFAAVRDGSLPSVRSDGGYSSPAGSSRRCWTALSRPSRRAAHGRRGVALTTEGSVTVGRRTPRMRLPSLL